MKRFSVFVIIILVSISPLFRGLFFNYEKYAFLAVIAFLLIIYLFVKMWNNEEVYVNKWFAVFGIVFIGAAALSFIKAVNPRENLEYILQYAEFFTVFLVLNDCFHGKKRLLISSIMLPVLIAGFFAALAGLMSLSHTLEFLGIPPDGNRLQSTFQYSNTASIYFVICFLFALTLINTFKNAIISILAAGIGNIIIFALILTGSRGGFLVGFAAILLFIAIQPSGSKTRGAAGLVCMLAPVLTVLRSFNLAALAHNDLSAAKWLLISFMLAVLFYLIYIVSAKLLFKGRTIPAPKYSGFIMAGACAAVVVLAILLKEKLFALLPAQIGTRFVRFSFNDLTFLYRLDFDRYALRLIKSNWLFGLGGGGWNALYQSVEDYFFIAAYAHNNYLQVFVESGIFGFLAYLALIGGGLANAVYSWFKAANRTLKIYSAGLLCGLLALAAHSAFDFDLTFISMSLLLWVMLAATSTGTDNKSEAPGIREQVTMRNWTVPAKQSFIQLGAVAVCAVLFSMNVLYLAGAYNEDQALKRMQVRNYKEAMTYYEEAYRFDHTNTVYTFELAKLYLYFAGKSPNSGDKQIWLEKAGTMGEKSVNGNRGYPAYMDTFAQIYLVLDMPLQALEWSEKLVASQKYSSGAYELLAQSYIASADYYKRNDDYGKAKELLENCLEIKSNPYLLKSYIDRSPKIMSPKKTYQQSKKLTVLLNTALNDYKNLLD